MPRSKEEASLAGLVRALQVVLDSNPGNDPIQLCDQVKAISQLQVRHRAWIEALGEDPDEELSAAVDEFDAEWGKPACELEIGWLLSHGLLEAQRGQASDWQEMLDAANKLVEGR